MSTPQNPGNENPLAAAETPGAAEAVQPQPEQSAPNPQPWAEDPQASYPQQPWVDQQVQAQQPWLGQQAQPWAEQQTGNESWPVQQPQPWAEQQQQQPWAEPQAQAWPEQQIAYQQYGQPYVEQQAYPDQQQYAVPQQYAPQQQYATQYQYPEQQYPEQQQQYPAHQPAPGSPYPPNYATNYAPSPHMPSGSKPKRMWILWVSIAAGLVVILTLGAVVYEFGKIFSGFTPQPSPTVLTPPKPTLAAEGELYKQTDEHLTGMIEKYQAMSVDEIAALFPGGAAGYDETYVRDFQLLLEDLDRRLTELGGFTVYEDANYDTEIRRILTDSDEIEWSFLHQEKFPLGVSMTLADGTYYESDGRYFPQGTPDFNAAREDFARNFVPYLDGDGSYAAAGEELVAALGMNLSYDFPAMFAYCPADGFTIQDTGGIGAAYCPAMRDTIYVNAQGNNYPNILYDLYYIDLLKHEFAHARTTGICATSQPGVTLGDAHFEATASSYAAMFLGADRDRMAWAAADYPAYTMTEVTDNAAQLIHDGSCG